MPLPESAIQTQRGASDTSKRSEKASQSAFYRMCGMLQRYAQSVDYAQAETDEDVVRVFVHLTGRSGAFIKYRTAINHFLRYLRSSGVGISSAALPEFEGFLAHTCSTSCVPSHKPVKRGDALAIPRLLLFLQYQGVAGTHGWTSGDPDLCVEFLNQLIAEGVGPGRAHDQAKIALHFIVWSRLKGVSPSTIDNHVIGDFIAHDCRCGLHLCSGRLDRQAEARRRVAVRRFLRFREGRSAVFQDGVFYQERERTILWPSALRYREWLSAVRGLKPRTIYFYVLDVMSWLPSIGEDASSYTAASIRELATFEFSKRSVAMQGRFIKSVRSYIMFRAYEGHCSTSLAHALISRPTYRLSSVPRRLDLSAVARVIERCDVATSRGLRDRAILTLLAELGLRATEVWRLTTSDFNWREARINIVGKGGRGAVVPLTQRAGDAVLDYLERGRPVAPSDALFLRLSRPYVPLANAAEISGIARQALGKCGLQGGAHVFRHTLATELLRSGRALEDIATILRHRSTDTTMIYAKVNDRMLRRLADPWTGEQL